MTHSFDFTARQAEMLHRLLYGKNFQSGTREHIARWISGKKRADTPTRAFVSRLIDLSFLTSAGSRSVRVGSTFIDRPVYDRDKKRIKEFWFQTSYHTMTDAIYQEDHVVI